MISAVFMVSLVLHQGVTESQPKETRLDQHGDPLPAGALGRIGTTRLRDYAWDLAFAPDGKTLASASGRAGGGVHLWDVRSGRLIDILPQPKPLRLAFSADGKSLASGSWDGEIVLFDLPTRKGIGRFLGHEQELYSLAFSPDGKLLASVGRDETARLWDVASRKELWRIPVPERPADLPQLKGWYGIYCAAFSPDSKMLATAGDDGTIRLWDWAKRKELRRLEKHAGLVETLAFAADGTLLFSLGKEAVNVWDAASGKKLHHDKNGTWWGGAIAPDGKFFAVVRTGAISLQASANGKEIGNLPVRANVMAISADSKLLATAGVGQAIQIWNLAAAKPIHDLGGYQQAITAVAFAGRGKFLASASTERANLWEAKTGKKIRMLHDKLRWDPVLASSPDGKFLAVGSEEIALWDLDAGRIVHRIPEELLSRPCLAFSPDSRSLVAPSRVPSLNIWDVGTGKKTGTLRLRPFEANIRELFGNSLHDALWRSIAFSPDGGTITSAGIKASNSKIVCVQWDKKSGTQKNVFLGPSGYVLTLSSDGRLLAHVDEDANECDVMTVRDAATGKIRHQFELPRLEKGKPPHTIAFSPEGRTLATGGSWDHTVRLWELATGLERHRFLGHRDGYIKVAFSPDGRMLASASQDVTALVWDLPDLANSKVAAPLAEKELQKLWVELLDRDAATAYRSIWALTLDPQRSVPFLAKHLRPVAPADAAEIARFIDQLDHAQFAMRQKAAQGLTELGERAAPALRAALPQKTSVEGRRRVEQLLSQAESRVPSQEYLRRLRALEVMELVATPEARQILEALAKGAPDAYLTAEAGASLQRSSDFSKLIPKMK